MRWLLNNARVQRRSFMTMLSVNYEAGKNVLVKPDNDAY